MMFFLLLTPLPARAEMTVTIVNGSSLEINYLYLDSGEGTSCIYKLTYIILFKYIINKIFY